MKAQGLVRQSAAALVLVLAIMVGGPFAIGPDTSAKGFRQRCTPSAPAAAIHRHPARASSLS